MIKELTGWRSMERKEIVMDENGVTINGKNMSKEVSSDSKDLRSLRPIMTNSSMQSRR